MSPSMGKSRGKISKGSTAPAQLDPSVMAEGDTFEHVCPYCPAKTQGGWGGLANHVLTVHPGENVPNETMKGGGPK